MGETDRELLEKAAKAAGYALGVWHAGYFIAGQEPFRGWNPLTDDGDALRLAVRLKIHMHTGFGTHVLDAPDPYAATRRAIVRAAAALEEPHHAG